MMAQKNISPFNKYLDYGLMVMSFALFLILLFWGTSWADRDAHGFQQKFLMSFEPKWLTVLFGLLLLLLILVFPKIKELLRLAFEGWSLKSAQTWVFLGAIIGALALMIFVAPKQHRIFYDEDIYIQIADHIARKGEVAMANDVRFAHGNYAVFAKEFNKEPNGHTFVLSRWLGFFNNAETAAFWLNRVTFLLTSFIVFLFGVALFGRVTGLIGALFWLSIPQNIIWANTAAVEHTTAFFAALAVLLSLIYYLNPTRLILFTSLVAATAASTFRPEAALIFVPCLAFLGIGFYQSFKNSPEKGNLKKIFSNLYWQFILTAFLFLPHFWHMYSVRMMNWGAVRGGKFDSKYIEPNFNTNLMYYFKQDGNEGIPFIITLLALCALVLCFFKRSKIQITSSWIKFLWFAVIFAIFIPFYAGSYKYGMDMRFAILTHIPLCVLAALGLSGILEFLDLRKKLLTVGVALTLILFSPSWRSIPVGDAQAWASIFDHDVMMEVSETLPPMSYVFSHNPSAFTPHHVSAGQLHVLRGHGEGLVRALSNTFEGGVYAYYGYWCQTFSPRERQLCKDIEEKYPQEVTDEWTENGKKWTRRGKTYKLVKLSIPQVPLTRPNE
jgi:hypothetical protein